MRIFKKRDVTKHYSGYQMEEDEMGRASGTYWGKYIYIYIYVCVCVCVCVLVGKHEEKGPLGRSRSRWVHIKPHSKHGAWKGVEWFHLAQD